MFRASYIAKLQPLIRTLAISPRCVVTSSPCDYRIKQLPRTEILPQQTRHICVTVPRQKFNKKSSKQDEESDSEDETVAEFKDKRDSKVVKAHVNSLRADLLLKAGLGIARNKVENIFYESRIRVNGKKLSKTGVQPNKGDEIDVIRGFSQTNPSHLVVSRVILLSATEREALYLYVVVNWILSSMVNLRSMVEFNAHHTSTGTVVVYLETCVQQFLTVLTLTFR